MKSETTEKLKTRSIGTMKLTCPECQHSFEFPEIFHKPKDVKEKGLGLASNICPSCSSLIPTAYISNRVRLFLKQA